MTEKTAYELQNELNQRIVNEFVLDKFTTLIGVLRFLKRVGFTDDELVEMVTELKPDIVVVSNHGGRIETRKGSTAEFLQEYGNILKSNCK